MIFSDPSGLMLLTFTRNILQSTATYWTWISAACPAT